MARGKDPTVRFAVGDVGGLHSAVWRCWATGSDLYLKQRYSKRATSAELKFSLHASGVWRYAFQRPPSLAPPHVKKAGDRVVERWSPPAEFHPGWRKCLHLIVPAVKVRERFTMADTDEPAGEITWLAAPGVGEKLTVTLLLAGSRRQDPRDVMADGDNLVGSLPLQNTMAYHLVSRIERASEYEATHFQEIIDGTTLDLPAGGRPNLATLSVVQVNTGGPIIAADMAMGWEHFRVGGQPATRRLQQGETRTECPRWALSAQRPSHTDPHRSRRRGDPDTSVSFAPVDLRFSADEEVSASEVREWLAGKLMLRPVHVAIFNADVTGVVRAKRGLLIGSPPKAAAP